MVIILLNLKDLAYIKWSLIAFQSREYLLNCKILLLSASIMD